MLPRELRGRKANSEGKKPANSLRDDERRKLKGERGRERTTSLQLRRRGGKKRKKEEEKDRAGKPGRS